MLETKRTLKRSLRQKSLKRKNQKPDKEIRTLVILREKAGLRTNSLTDGAKVDQKYE